MSIFPTKALLATDGSREAALAARTAADLAEKTRSELHPQAAGWHLGVLLGPPVRSRPLLGSRGPATHCIADKRGPHQRRRTP
jgi:nucleotide-binding universal stress UspA family protein